MSGHRAGRQTDAGTAAADRLRGDGLPRSDDGSRSLPAFGGATSLAGASYIRNAIAPATQRAYATAVAAFRQSRSDVGDAEIDSPFTADAACSWLGLLGVRGQLKHSTIRTYASALSTWFDTNLRPDSRLPNPMQSGTSAGCSLVSSES